MEALRSPMQSPTPRRSRAMTRRLSCLLLLAVGSWFFQLVVAEGAPVPSRRVLVCGPRTAIVEISPEHPDGKVEWSHPANSREGWVLPTGNILLALSRGDGGPGGAAVEIERGSNGAADREVWRYDGTQEEVNSIQKTAEGTYVLTEAGPAPRLLEIDAAGAVKVEFPLLCQKANGHMQTRMTRKQTDGTYLCPHLFDFAIIRYGPTGKELSRIGTRDPAAPQLNTWPFTAITLPDGGILAGLTNGNRVVEFDREGKIRWQIDTADVDGAIADACGIQRLPSGNTMIASYHVGRQGERLVEVSPEKKVVWSWKADVPAVHHFQVLSIDGGDLDGPPLR
jgi:hypothetical protein